MQDNEIISLFEIRDEHAIEALSDKYHPYCYKIAWNLLTNKEDSEECLNDTWFSVWSLIPPKKPSVLSHFCGRITRNLSIDRLRKKYADRRPDVHMADVLGEMDQLSVTYTIEDQLAEKELLEIINDFLEEWYKMYRKYPSPRGDDEEEKYTLCRYEYPNQITEVSQYELLKRKALQAEIKNLQVKIDTLEKKNKEGD